MCAGFRHAIFALAAIRYEQQREQVRKLSLLTSASKNARRTSTLSPAMVEGPSNIAELALRGSIHRTACDGWRHAICASARIC